jgi:hypothetical protein
MPFQVPERIPMDEIQGNIPFPIPGQNPLELFDVPLGMQRLPEVFTLAKRTPPRKPIVIPMKRQEVLEVVE